MNAKSAEDEALLELLRVLRAQDYRFITPTPVTHARVVARPDRQRAKSVRDVFGWSLPFDEGAVDRNLVELMRSADILEPDEAGFRSRLRVSTAPRAGREGFFLHSAYPTDEEDAVFFGPDSYRFAAFVRQELPPGRPGELVIDVGAGAGVGAITAAEHRPDGAFLLTDVNAEALRLARLNAEDAGVPIEVQQADGLKGVDHRIDVALANPPYIVDASGRAYRDGGDMHGGKLSLELATAAVERLSPGGRLLLYTGAAILDGVNPLELALRRMAEGRGCAFTCREIDPDVFGEELEGEAYADVDRIAVIGAVIVRPL